MAAAEASAAQQAQQALSFEDSLYTSRARNLVTLVNHLREAGAQLALSLPAMVVVGNQSAGKSSLLERLCAIKLPRAAGTCTKCPTEVRLSTAPPGGADTTWCCQVKLRQEYDKNDCPLQSKPKEEIFKILTQAQQEVVHIYIAAAQRALLNPDTPADLFVKDADAAAAAAAAAAKKRSTDTTSPVGGADGGNSNTSDGGMSEDSLPFEDAADAASGAAAAVKDALKFTRNVVVLEVTGADVDLTLIDLPGIIQTEADDEGSGNNVQLVKQLVQDHIASERADIVATISCKDDMENEEIVRMASSADKDGHRTIGVLTKVDRIEIGTHHTWMPVLQGTSFPLRLGYFAVVNPSQDDINKGITLEAASTNEATFFDKDPFFGSEHTAQVRARFGVAALRAELSKQLVALTQRELPKMKEALENAIVRTEGQLRKLPPPPAADASLELMRRARDLSMSVAQAIDGKGEHTDFFRATDAAYRRLQAAVLAARPTVRLTDEDGDEQGGEQVDEEGDGSMEEEGMDFWLDGPAAASGGNPEGLITLEHVQQLANKYRTRELPGFQPYRVLEELVRGLRGRWDDAAFACVRAVSEQLQALTDQVVQQHFGQFAAAKQLISDRLYDSHARLEAATEQRVSELMEMERTQIVTYNSHYLSCSKDAFMTRLSQQLYGAGSAGGAQGDAWDRVNEAMGKLHEAGLDVDLKDLDAALAHKKQRAAQHEDGLLDLIAGTLAYYKVSSKRVIDNVPMTIHRLLLEEFAHTLDALQVELAAGLHAAPVAAPAGVTDSDGGAQGTVPLNTAELMAEEKSTAERRAQLRRQLEQLQGVRKILSVF